MTMKTIIYDKQDNVAWLTLNRPEVLNAQNALLLEELYSGLERANEDDEVFVIVITGAGDRAFSAGADIGEFTSWYAIDVIKKYKGAKRTYELVREIPKPVIAMVNGLALGGGCELAIFCDLVVSSKSAKLGQPEIQVGVFPPIAAQIMPRIIGRKAAMDLILSGRIISAEEALQMGLVNKVVADGELDSATTEFLKPYLKLSAEVLRKTKKAIMAGLTDDLELSLRIIEDIYLNELMKTVDAQEGLKSFLEKRKPEWKNE